jgi:hypothetical protein
VAWVLLTAALTACSPAAEPSAAPSSAAPSPSPSAVARTPSTSSADVTVEPSDSGIEAVRAVFAAVTGDDPRAVLRLLGPKTRALVRTPDQLRGLRDQLAPLLVGDSPPFDDVIVSQTPTERVHFVVLGDRDSDTLTAAEVVVRGDRVQVELFPPAAANIAFDIDRRQRIQVTTPPAELVELLVDGFHFHPTESATGPAIMNLPFPLTPRTHVLGAWYRAADGSTGARTQAISVADE